MRGMTSGSGHQGDEIDFGAWVLRLSGAELDVDGVLERFGQVYRCPIEPSDRAELLAPGQPCFLIRTDRSKVVGIWAVGEVVAPTLTLPAGTELLPGEAAMKPSLAVADARTYAEVELVPLSKAIALDKLRADPVLARSEPVASPDLSDPLVLTPAEVRALEAIDFWMEPPTDEQRSALDRLLAAEDDLLDHL
jgi:hypothetical protein